MEEKIKLEEELEFLKESFDAEVISKEEYEKAKSRLETQLSNIELKKTEPKKIQRRWSIDEKMIRKRQRPGMLQYWMFTFIF